VGTGDCFRKFTPPKKIIYNTTRTVDLAWTFAPRRSYHFGKFSAARKSAMRNTPIRDLRGSVVSGCSGRCALAAVEKSRQIRTNFYARRRSRRT
jgi:hypothetical protein